MPSKVFIFSYLGKRIKLGYFTDGDIAAAEGGGARKFQELPLLERIRDMELTGTYVDVGANIGNHTIYFANFCKAERVVAIEAHPAIFEILQSNIHRNTHTTVQKMNLAAWDRKETLWLDDPVRGNAGRTQIVGLGKYGQRRRLRTVGVPLDVELRRHDNISLVKIDVEDAEMHVLRGMQGILVSQKPVVVTEAHNCHFLKQQTDFLEPMGYRLDPTSYDPRGETRLWIPTSKA